MWLRTPGGLRSASGNAVLSLGDQMVPRLRP